MKLFCAYAFTGENVEILTQRMRVVVDTLRANEHSAYCNRFDAVVDKLQKEDDIKGIFREAFRNIEQSEAVVAIIASPNRSIDQIMEIGIAMSQGKQIFLFEHESAVDSSYLPRLVDKHFVWKDMDDLRHALAQI